MDNYCQVGINRISNYSHGFLEVSLIVCSTATGSINLLVPSLWKSLGPLTGTWNCNLLSLNFLEDVGPKQVLYGLRYLHSLEEMENSTYFFLYKEF